jgi:hypothetical protein
LNRQHFDSHQLSLLIPYDTTTVSSFLLSDVCNDDGTGTQPVVGSRPSLKHMYDVSPTFVRLVQACHLHSNRSTEDVMPSCALLLYSMHLARLMVNGQSFARAKLVITSTERHTDYVLYALWRILCKISKRTKAIGCRHSRRRPR